MKPPWDTNKHALSETISNQSYSPAHQGHQRRTRSSRPPSSEEQCSHQISAGETGLKLNRTILVTEIFLSNTIFYSLTKKPCYYGRVIIFGHCVIVPLMLMVLMLPLVKQGWLVVVSVVGNTAPWGCKHRRRDSLWRHRQCHSADKHTFTQVFKCACIQYCSIQYFLCNDT